MALVDHRSAAMLAGSSQHAMLRSTEMFENMKDMQCNVLAEIFRYTELELTKYGCKYINRLIQLTLIYSVYCCNYMWITAVCVSKSTGFW